MLQHGAGCIWLAPVLLLGMKKDTTRAGGTAQWAKRLFQKREDQSSKPKPPCEKLDLGAEVELGCVVDTQRPLDLTGP